MNPATTSLQKAFNNCTNLKFIDNLDELVNVTNMKACFYSCSALEYVQDLSGMTSLTVVEEAFRNCSSLVKVFGFPHALAATNVNIGNMCVNDTHLTSFIIPQGAGATGWAFGYCTSLRKVEIYEENMTTSHIVSSTFYNCTDLTVYCNADTTTYATLIQLFGSSTNITIKTFGGGGALPSIVVWGDSISSPGKAWIEWPARLQNKIGTADYLIKNEALAGEWSTSTTARQGGYVMTTNAFTIPADTTPT